MSVVAAPDMLQAIMTRKRAEVAAAKAVRPLGEVEAAARTASAVRGFRRALQTKAEREGVALIAEVKKASPSKGLIREDFHPAEHARAYAAGGAACLSVLTDTEGFQGEPAHMVAARAACDLPVLRKDFMREPYQIVESRALGADAVLLIMAVLEDARAQTLMETAAAWDLDVLVEVHDRTELERAAQLGATLIGVNNRDLRHFTTDLATFEALAPHAPASTLLVAESGIAAPEDVARMRRAGAHAVLVGESLMRQDDPGAAAEALMTGARQP